MLIEGYVSFDFGQEISVLVKLVFLFRHENVIMKIEA